MTPEQQTPASVVERLREAANASPGSHSGYAGSGWINVVQQDVAAILKHVERLSAEREGLRGALERIQNIKSPTDLAGRLACQHIASQAL